MLGLDFSGNDTRQDLMSGTGGGRTFKLISFFQNADDAEKLAEQAALVETNRASHHQMLSKDETKRDHRNVNATVGREKHGTNFTGTIDPGQRATIASMQFSSGIIRG